ncbi:DUF3971 domain-containing protein [Hyphococcus sp.]|uniref:YhdP family protein n=1 Tax=Hyphococcus sp. TaxID=2038636 RepID=UPI00208005CD|nr:MAG: hypothetical protein DHS20C04_11690 [Marinicaulis sp.]
MKKRALKTAILAIEVFAIAVAAAAAAIAFLHWRLGQGPVELTIFRPSAEFAIERQWPQGYQASVGAIEIRRMEDRGVYQFRLADVVVADRQAVPAASAPEVLVNFDLGDLFSGKAGPKSVSIDGARIRIVRQANLNVEIPIVKQREGKSKGRRLSALLNAGLSKSAFQSAIVSNAEIVFFDVTSGRSWSSPDSEIRLIRNENGLTAQTHGEIDMDGVRAEFRAIADYSKTTRTVNVTADGVNFPVGDLLSMFYGDEAMVVDAPISGRAIMAFTVDGEVLSSKFDAQLGEGHLNVAGVRRKLSQVSLKTEFDPIKNAFSIEQFEFDFEGGRGSLLGNVSISFGDDIRKPESISFDLTSDEVVVSVQPNLPDDLPVTAISIGGRYHVTERRLLIDSLAAQFAGLSATGSLSLMRQQVAAGKTALSPGVLANMNFEGTLNPKSLLSIWPVNVANGARDWVEERLIDAEIDNLEFEMNLQPGAVAANGALPDDAMMLTFDARKASAAYVRGMTPLRNGSGSGILRGNSFMLNVDAARVGDVAISKGEVSFPEFMPKWQPTYYRFSAKGKAEDMLAILDEAPLSLLSKVDLKPGQFAGDANAIVEIMRPNKRDVAPQEYGYKGKASFENLKLAELLGDIEITDAKGAVDLQTRSLRVEADAALASEAPIHMVWRQNFYKEDGPSGLNIAGVFDSSTGDVFGLSTRQFLRGPVKFEANATGDVGAFETLRVNADFKDATLSVIGLDWRKPEGASAKGDIDMSFHRDGVMIDALSLFGEGVDISGTLSFSQNGALQKADLRKFYLADSAELAIMGDRDGTGVLGLTFVGPYLNVGPAIEQILNGAESSGQSAGFDWGAGVSVQARIDQIGMRNGIEYRDGALDLRRDADRLQSLDFSALGTDGRPVTVAMAMTGATEGPQRAIEARTGAIGELMSAVFGVNSVSGGEGSMRIALHPAGEPGFSGELEARNLQVVNAPLLARIFSAGSLDGLANLMSGEGIEFNYAYGQFDYANGIVSVEDMRATGSSVGITADGYVDIRAEGASDLSGAVAPIYALNSVLGNTPIIGDILVGKKGEGLLAFTYRVSGATEDPTVFVNPLSALTPGIFRQLMQPGRATKPESTEGAAPVEAREETVPEAPAQ